MSEPRIYDVIIIGGGPAGYTSALYCARAGLDTLVLEKLGAGGQMTLTESIDNYPGIPGTDGFTLGRTIQEQAEKFGARSELTKVTGVDTEGNIKVIHTTDMGDMLAYSVVIATGAGARKLGLSDEDKLADNGIHYCAACDGMRFKGKVTAVVGGGNTALEDALLLSRLCSRVYLIHRRDEYRADRVYIDSVEKTENIIPVLSSTADSVQIEDNIFKGINVRSTKDGKVKFLPADGLFVSVGRIPDTDFLKDLVKKDKNGYICADETTCTSVPGIFAAGDVRTKPMRQIVTAAADGAVSSVFAQTHVAKVKAKKD